MLFEPCSAEDSSKPPKLNQEEINILNKHIANKEPKILMKSLLLVGGKKLRPDEFTTQVYQTFKKDL